MSSTSRSSSRPVGPRYKNIECRCHQRAALKISVKAENRYELYYCCPVGGGGSCRFFAWAYPIELPGSSADNGVTGNAEMQQLSAKEEYRKLKNKMKQMENSIELIKFMLAALLVGFFALFITVIFKS